MTGEGLIQDVCGAVPGGDDCLVSPLPSAADSEGLSMLLLACTHPLATPSSSSVDPVDLLEPVETNLVCVVCSFPAGMFGPGEDMLGLGEDTNPTAVMSPIGDPIAVQASQSFKEIVLATNRARLCCTTLWWFVSP